MTSYPCPEWLKRRRITDEEYGRWLDHQTSKVWMREKKHCKTACTTPGELKQVLHVAAHASNGRDPYSGARFFVKHLRAGWSDAQAHLNGNRHYLTLRRCMPSFDHVKGLGHKAYELCTRETNAAKSYMSPTQFVDLCRRVVHHRDNQAPTPA
ncbi:hypothetical protein [Sphingomonas bacterium]|uniref:hypothetical protein n=1 Tax=Sphingomonas bacterium TaxID=1895847 RepID=UPI0026151D0C|nr:hypothetical protein [Sphingomonas bacterium]MDB5679131.1 hypothetical protein [Sphingomonas bacterium]